MHLVRNIFWKLLYAKYVFMRYDVQEHAFYDTGSLSWRVTGDMSTINATVVETLTQVRCAALLKRKIN